MFLFIGKLILLYFATIIFIRLMGKSAFAQLTAHDLAGIFFVITLATGPIVTENFIKTLTGLIAVSILHISFSKLMLVNRLKRIFIGEPTIVIKHGKILRKNLTGSNFTLSEILSEAREKGYPDITSIDYGVVEPNGGISVIPKQGLSPVTAEQMDIETSYLGIPLAVIIEGSIQQDNLQLISKDEHWLKREIEREGYPDIDRIFYAAVRDTDHSLIIDTGRGHTHHQKRKGYN